ncbi:MAG: 7-cyano-7-deazaguanine synthase QueC [Syntrophomonadaceae bacterium]|nr:7-cyano-7-deazaguanine synthase QueC [Syntrophomonadaceae bacterium]MDH7496984.1 7-cyano-7-deazaguanine synthase QueC [Syntrophomonadaceae bacterium]
MQDEAVVLLSGGLDSTVCMAVAAQQHRLWPITFAYGQRHAREVEQARQVAAHFGVARHLVVDCGFFRDIGGSSLTVHHLEVPLGREEAQLGTDIPSTYVPFRNGVFLALAVAYAESVGAATVFIGVNALDYSGYPDCRPQFIEAFQAAVNAGTAAGARGNPITIAAPLLHLDKAGIVRLGARLGAPFELTSSCYLGGEVACGQCDACRLRLKGFREAGLADPIPYAVTPAAGP